MPDRTEAWMAVVQDADGNEETELVSIAGHAPLMQTDGENVELLECVNCGGYDVGFKPGTTIELTNGQRITLIEPAGEKAA